MDRPIEIIEIDNSNIEHLNNFLSNNMPDSFRYFNTRNITCIKNHLLTLIIVIDNKSVGYAHIDKENDKYWFGICIIKEYQGIGLGTMLIKYILNKSPNDKLSLTVDRNNFDAIKLYKKFGFEIVDDDNIKGNYFWYMEKN
jgi:ribosomal protein S18 acetylase RimI-like enzyme